MGGGDQTYGRCWNTRPVQVGKTPPYEAGTTVWKDFISPQNGVGITQDASSLMKQPNTKNGTGGIATPNRNFYNIHRTNYGPSQRCMNTL